MRSTILLCALRLATPGALGDTSDATTHFIGQSTLFTLEGDRATGEAYCLTHHVTVDSGKKRLMGRPKQFREWKRSLPVVTLWSIPLLRRSLCGSALYS